MGSSGSKLKEYWRAQGLPLAPPAAQEDIRAFEAKHGIAFPSSFKEYLSAVNGMIQVGDASEDKEGFSFWQLRGMKSLVRVEKEDGVSSVSVDPEKYFVFSDYFQWSWAYAINVDPTSPVWGQVIHIGTLTPNVVAASFDEFVDLYIANSKMLYPPQ